MRTNEIIQAEVCVDCAMYWANGEFPEGVTFEREMELATCPGVPDNCTVAIGDDAGFSWSPCEACGSKLGGDRFEAVYLPTTPA